MDSQAEYLESSGGSDLFRNVATGEKTSFITYPVHIDRHGRYRMDDKALVISQDADGREERWWIEYIPVTHPGLAYSARIWQEPVANPRKAMLASLLSLASLAILLTQLWALWLWLKG